MITRQPVHSKRAGKAIVFYIAEVALILGVSYGLLIALGGPKIEAPRGGGAPGGIRQPGGGREAMIPINAHWPNAEAMLASAPQTKLVDKEITLEDVKYIIQVPADAPGEPKLSGSFSIPLSAGARLELRSGIYNLEERKNPEIYFSGSPKEIAYLDKDLMLVEFSGEDSDRFVAFYNISVGPRDYCAAISRTDEAYGKKTSLESCLLGLKCLRSLKLKEADPTKPAELLEKYGARAELKNDKIIEVRFPTEVTPTLLAVIAQCPEVEELSVHVDNLKPDSLGVLAKLPQLRRLGLSDTLKHAQQFRDVCACRKLEKLSFDPLKGSSALDGIDQLTELRELYIGGLPSEAATSLSKLGKLTKLQSLTIYTNNVSDQVSPGFWDFLPNLKNLKELKLAFRLPDEALLTISKLPNLERFELSEAPVGDKGLASLGTLKNLTELKVSGPGSYREVAQATATGSGLAALKGLDKLKEIELENLPITDDSLKSLKQFLALERLSLQGTKITDAGLQHIEALSTLNRLTLSGNSQLSKGVEQRLKKALPKASISAY